VLKAFYSDLISAVLPFSSMPRPYLFLIILARELPLCFYLSFFGERKQLSSDPPCNISFAAAYASRAGLSSTVILFTENLNPLATPPALLAATSLQSSTADLDPQPLTPVTHPCSVTSIANGSTDIPSATADTALKYKHHAFASHCIPGLKFSAYAIQSYGYVDKDGMDLMRSLARESSSTSKGRYGSVVASSRMEVSVALCNGNHAIFGAGEPLCFHVSGHARVSGLLVPSADDGPGKTLNSAAGLPARVQIPVPPSATSRLLYELLGRVLLGFLVVSPFRIACVLLHVEQGRSSKRVWRSPRIIYLLGLEALLWQLQLPSRRAHAFSRHPPLSL
jgi:hypothetical protein